MSQGTQKVLAADHGIVLGCWERFFLLVYTGATSMESVALLREQFARFRASSSGACGLYIVVEESAPLPPGPVRDGIATFLKEGAGDVFGGVLVQEGSGFRAAAVRSVATGLILLSRLPYPHQVCSSMPAANAWLATSFPGVSAQALSDAVTGIRRAAAS